MTHTLPQLPYDYSQLEPHIDAQTMQIHHSKHHATYVAKLNAALEQFPELFETPLEELIADLDKLPQEIQSAVRNNGGGHLNHTLFWKILTPGGSKQPIKQLAVAIEQTFGSFEDFKKELQTTAINRFGSGWAWLSVDEKGKLIIESTPNQDTPLMHNHTPLLGIDVWEHAYYLKYQNKRPDYLEAIWNVINWDNVSERYEEATQ